MKLSYEIVEHQKGDRGDVARVSRRLSEALSQNGEHEEATQLKEMAEGIRESIQGTRFKDLPDNERSYNLLVSMNYW